MYKPNFRVTNKIINHIAEISAARELILNAPILPQWEVKLRKEAILKMAHHSTSIEGNRLTLEQVENLLAGEEVPAWEKDKIEVENYVKVLEYIDRLGSEGEQRIAEEIILEIHWLTTKGLLDETESGHCRRVPVAVVDGLGRTVFQPPPVEKVPRLMEEFVAWLNSEKATELCTSPATRPSMPAARSDGRSGPLTASLMSVSQIARIRMLDWGRALP